MLHVNIIFPPFSEGGNYRLLIAHDREGKTALVCANGFATAKGSTAKLDVSLDLRGVKPGELPAVDRTRGSIRFLFLSFEGGVIPPHLRRQPCHACLRAA